MEIAATGADLWFCLNSFGGWRQSPSRECFTDEDIGGKAKTGAAETGSQFRMDGITPHSKSSYFNCNWVILSGGHILGYFWLNVDWRGSVMVNLRLFRLLGGHSVCIGPQVGCAALGN